MATELSENKRQMCCRLCLAPDDECVSIFTTSGSDKEPLPVKIQACVNIKVHELDRLSSRICHFCIGFLNSWQSFKNRCYAAQKKQTFWLSMQLQQQQQQQKQGQQMGDEKAENQTQLSSSISSPIQRLLPAVKRHHDGSLVRSGITSQTSEGYYFPQYEETSKRIRNGQPVVLPGHQQPSHELDVSIIKQEPNDEEDQDEPVTVNMELDPSQFLANEDDIDFINEDGDESGAAMITTEGGPPILTSLGLTHINHVNPYNYLATDLEEYDPDQMDENSLLYQQQQQRRRHASVPATCTICNMKFSNRANARRHERNIHGIAINSILNNSDLASVVDAKRKFPLSGPGISISSTPKINKENTSSNGSLPLKSIIRSAPSRSVKSVKKLKAVPEVFDYTKPEKYRLLLTDYKLGFIRQHMEFLTQYQQMKCNCCERSYTTYKTFMSHIRKKYVTLPRNVCFKCLRQFGTKGQFIAHLKKKNCINLFTIYMADDTISKDSKYIPILNRIGPKEILANKVYGCKLCTEHFRLKLDFRQHVNEVHQDAQKSKDPSNSNCGYCNTEFADATQRKRHFGNLECIVFLICGTCQERFENHAEYIKHVYATHLLEQKATLSNIVSNTTNDNQLQDDLITDHQMMMMSQNAMRHPQNCPVCGKQYNNYYNVLRHMEVKHPDKMPKTYQCEICQTGFPRQTELREHVRSAHSELSLTKVKPINFVCQVCKEQFDKKETWIDHQVIHDVFTCQQCEYTNPSREEFETHLSTHLKIKVYSCSICKHSYNTEKGLQYHMITSHMKNDDSTATENGDTSGDIPDESLVLLSKLDGVEIIAKQKECPVCHEYFVTGVAFANHIRIHKAQLAKNPSTQSAEKKEPPKSYDADESSGTPNTSTSAKTTPTVYNSRMRCRICQKRINTKMGYKRHLLVAHQIRNCQFVSCDLCPAEFSNGKGLKVHMFRTHNIQLRDDIFDPKLEQHYECNICHTVYRSREQLKNHSNTVHGFDNYHDFEDAVKGNDTKGINDYTPLEVWFQCRYCTESFNSNKKLTIHMNSHEEHDASDNTCKDCGNVYGTRKSLWVHRHKKHPRPQMPTPCEICNKIFFDKTELIYHLKTHTSENFNFMNDMLMDQDGANGGNGEETETVGKYSCHVCGRKFQDKAPLSKHLRIHEMQNNMFNSPLLSSAYSHIVGETDSYSSYNSTTLANNDGEFSCDICPKTFTVLSALKVHRGWHFRSPDGRQVTDPSNIWQPDTMPPSKAKRFRSMHNKPPTCPYCHSTFASSNNLRRHIVEVHKRNESKVQRESNSPAIFIEKERECQACNIVFDSRLEWIEHKIMHAKTQKPSTTFEWNCEICGKMFTRKERLLQHMVTHLNSKAPGEEDASNGSQDGMKRTVDSDGHIDQNSQSTVTSQTSSSSAASSISERGDRNIKRNDYDDDEDDDDVDIESGENNKARQQQQQQQGAYSCDLCQVYFTTAKELRRHVSTHFINGSGTIGNEQIQHESPPPQQSLPDQDTKENIKKENNVKPEEIDDSQDATELKKISNEKPGTPQSIVDIDDDDDDDDEDDDDDNDDANGDDEEDENEDDDEDEDEVEDDNEDDGDVDQNQIVDEDDDVEEDGDDDDVEEDDEEEENDYGEEDDNVIDSENDDEVIEDDADLDQKPPQLLGELLKQQQRLHEIKKDDDNSPQYKCRLCAAPQSDHFSWIRCMESHRVPSKHNCTECQLYFADTKQVADHERLIHSAKF